MSEESIEKVTTSDITFAPTLINYYPLPDSKCNGLSLISKSNSLLFVDATKIYQFRAKDLEIKDFTLSLGNISRDFTIDNMGGGGRERGGLKGIVKVFLLILMLLILMIL